MTTTPLPQVHARPARDDADFWRVRGLLVETYPITPLGFNWEVRRWEGRRFYTADPDQDTDWLERLHLWETSEGRLVAAVHPEGQEDAWLEVHPEYRHLEGELLDWAEEHLSAPTRTGDQRQLTIYAHDYDQARRRLLEEHGYAVLPGFGVVRRMRFAGQPLSHPALAEGYTLRSTRPDDLADRQRIADLLNAAFNRDFHTAQEYHTFTRLAPSFRAGLDLVAEAPDGSFAAYVGIPYDEANRLGIFEPVCTHPDHRRRGAALALMQEGLQRLQVLGAEAVMVGTGDMEPANRLYDALGFNEVVRGRDWRRVF